MFGKSHGAVDFAVYDKVVDERNQFRQLAREARADWEAAASERDRAYRDRNLLALSFVRSLHLLGLAGVGGVEIGWYPAPEDDDADSEEWAVVWADVPAFEAESRTTVRFGAATANVDGVPRGDTVGYRSDEQDKTVDVGQVSWHVPRDDVEACGGWLPRTEPAWDGHDRDEKNARLRRFVEAV